MFELTLHDHLRLAFGHVVHRHKVHLQTAQARTRQSRWLRAAEALLVAGVVGTSLGAAFEGLYAYSIASAMLAGLSLAVLLVHLIFDFDGSARAHAACAARLWQIRERYQALLSDLCDGAIDADGARQRRDQLMGELYGIYENAPPADERVYKAAGQAVVPGVEGSLSDEEIDLFLPKSLHKAMKSRTA
jgi:hypothetical protein